MGLFGKIFEKKVCDICGEEIKLLGNRKLEDGNLCKNCAGKLSPWFDERRHSTVEQIKEQLSYREANKADVAAFHETRSMGKNTRVILDEEAGKFVVTSAKDLTAANPDVIDVKKITSVEYEVKESRYEEKHTEKQPDGSSKQVSYIPPHYTYNYDFRIVIKVEHPYFDDISFNLNSTSVKISSVGELKVGGVATTSSVRGQSFGQVAINAAKQGVMNAAGVPVYTDPRMTNPDYATYMNMCMEIKDALLTLRAVKMGLPVPNAASQQPSMEDVYAAAQQVVQTNEILNALAAGTVAGAAAVEQPVEMSCPACGAKTTPGADGCCEYCGSKIR